MTVKVTRSLASDFGPGRATAGIAGMLVPGAQFAAPVGEAMGLLHDDPRAAIKARGSENLSYIPGVAQYRTGLINRAVADETGSAGRRQLLHEYLGAAVGTGGSTVAGSALGALLGQKLLRGTRYEKDSPVIGAIAGGIAGFTIPEVTAALVALHRKKRSEEEQRKHEASNVLLNYVPGVGSYNRWKRIGYGYDRYHKSPEILTVPAPGAGLLEASGVKLK